MKILIYIPDINQVSGGIRQYTVTLLKMLNQDTENEFYIYHDLEDPEIVQAIAGIPKHKLVTSAEIKIVRSKIYFRSVRFRNRLYKLFRRKKRIDIPDDFTTYCSNHQIQVIHCPYQFIPHINNVKLITTLHDIQEIHFPEYFTPDERAYRATEYLDFLRRSDAIIVSYEHIKQDLIKYFQIDSDKISVILLDIQKLWFEKYTGNDIRDISFLKLPENFLLYPANTWKHKNHLRLIEAVAEARDKYNVSIILVCTGHQNEHFVAINELIKSLNLQSLVYFTGVVDEVVLFNLYKKSKGVVIPTTYEAGSFPLMESILLNIPVICSNVTSLPETIRSEKFTFDPFNVEAITTQLINLWENNDFLNENISHINEAVNFLKSNNSLDKILAIYSSFK